MFKLWKLVCLFLTTSLLFGCNATNRSSRFIEPGGKVGDFLVTTGQEDETIYLWDLDCEVTNPENPSSQKYDCKASVGASVNPLVGIFDSTASGKLDEVWDEHVQEVTIDGLPVNLKAFGTINVDHPASGINRLWNVQVSGAVPGEVRVHDWGVAGGIQYNVVITIRFIEP